jgi:pilus assembly protein CpaF
MQEIFVFEREGVAEDGTVKGQFKSTGIRPQVSQRLHAYGIDLSELLFTPAGEEMKHAATRGW